MTMGSRRQALLRLAVGLAMAVLVGCGASTAATPAGTPDAATETDGADGADGADTGDWKDLVTEEPATGSSGDRTGELPCDGADPGAAPPRAC
jgi:hypothetical protein